MSRTALVSEIRYASPHVIDENMLNTGLSECTVYRIYDPNKKSMRYYYGGGLLRHDKSSVVLRLDYLRPSRYTTISLKHIMYVNYNGQIMDILLNTGEWISGMTVPKIKSNRCSLSMEKFDDMRIVTIRQGVAIVNIHSLDLSSSDYDSSKRSYSLTDTEYGWGNPITFAYKKQKDGIYIGIWDVVESKFVGELRKYWGRLLDINL